MNGVRESEGILVKWDSMVAIDSPGLRGETKYLLDASTENTTYTLSAEQTKALLGSVGSLEGLNFGIRGTSVGVDQEESVKLYSSDFVKDEVDELYVDEFDVSRTVVFFEKEVAYFGANRENQLASLEGSFFLADAATANEYDQALGTTYSQLIDSADDRIITGSSAFDFDTKTSVWDQYDSMDLALKAGQQVQFADITGTVVYIAERDGVYNLTKEGLYNEEQLMVSAKSTGEPLIGEFGQISVRSDSEIGLDFTLNSDYGLVRTSEEAFTTNEALVAAV